jgi:hypothetical protein
VLTLVILEAVVIAALGVLVVGLLRSHAEILRRLHELGAGVYDDDTVDVRDGVTSSIDLSDRPIRTREGVPEPRAGATPAADISGVTPDGNGKVVGVVGAEHSTLLAFLSSGCGTCGDFWRAFASGEADPLPGRSTRLVIVTKGAEDESISAVRALAPTGHTTVMSSAAFDDYGVPVSPYFILVDGPSSQVVGEGAAASWSQVANLLRQAAADAGVSTDGRALPTSGRPRAGDAREARADVDLLAAGIAPGHPSLYPDASDDDDERPASS